MAKQVNIHPYKGYLNTEFQITTHEQEAVGDVVQSKGNSSEAPIEIKEGVVEPNRPLANNNSKYEITGSWPLLSFARENGKMQVGSFKSVDENGELSTFKCCRFIRPESGKTIYVRFSKKLGTLTPKEIAKQKEVLQVIELQDIQSGKKTYSLTKKKYTMEKSLTVNTHHAYLNTDIIISSTYPDFDLEDINTGKKYHAAGNTIPPIKLSAGTHTLYSENLQEKIVVEIEDAIKLGGGRLKKAFVFDDNPWVFVVTKDRMYAAHIESKKEKVEHGLTPEEIQTFGMYENKPCNYFLLKTNKDYSIYNVLTGRIVYSFTNYIYGNSFLVIFKKEDTIVIYDYRKSKTIDKFCGKYSFGSKFFYVKDKILYGLNLNTGYVNEVPKVDKIEENYILKNSFLIKLVHRGAQKTYHLYSLGDGENNTIQATIHLPYYIFSFENNETQEYLDIKNEYEKYNEANKKAIYKDMLYVGVQITNCFIECKENHPSLAIEGKIVSYPTLNFGAAFVIPEEKYNQYSLRSECLGTNYMKQNPIPAKDGSKKDDTEDNLPKDETIWAKSASGNLIVSTSNDAIFLRNKAAKTRTELFATLYDHSVYNNAYFTSDGKNILFLKNDKTIGTLNCDSLLQTQFNIESCTVPRNRLNGYKPEIIIQDIRGQQPVWRDPITLRRVTETEMPNHVYMSPDGTITASTTMRSFYYNRLTKDEISQSEYQALQDKYNWDNTTSHEEKDKKLALRKQLMEQYGPESLFSYIHQRNEQLVRCEHMKQEWDEKEIFAEIKRLNEKDDREYLWEKPNFLPLFIDKLFYIDCQEKEGITHSILLGRSVWFMNYVSFSYDSRYIAIGAKMSRDEWRSSEDGVFIVYDLHTNKIVQSCNKNMSLFAVWMTMFSKDGNIAFYDSIPNTYIATADSEYKETKKIKDKSLLCFSPTGKYIALSDQGYRSSSHNPDSEAGHQPSGNVFIYSVDNLEKCLAHYKDHGTGIERTSATTSKKSKDGVASAAFSSDEKRFLTVGEDGVVVIRNLHLKE